MSYPLKCKVWKDDMSAPTLTPHIQDFLSVGPDGYSIPTHDSGNPYRIYTFQVKNEIEVAYMKWWLNVEILPEDGYWFFNFLVNLGATKVTVKVWYTLSDQTPLIVWNFEFKYSPLAWYQVKACAAHHTRYSWDHTYDKSSPYLAYYQKIEGGEDRVAWNFKADGRMGYVSAGLPGNIFHPIEQLRSIKY